MSNVNWNKVKKLSKKCYDGQGRAMYSSPLLYSFVYLISAYIINRDIDGIVSTTLMLMLLVSMIIPSTINIKKFAEAGHETDNNTIPADKIEKYLAMLLVIVVQSAVWFVISFVICSVMLIISGVLIYDTAPLEMLGKIYSLLSLSTIPGMVFISTMASLWNISSRTAALRRYTTYVLIVIAVLLHFVMAPLLMMSGRTAFVVTLGLYDFVIIILAVYFGYYQFKRII